MSEEKKEPKQVDGERPEPGADDAIVNLPALLSDEFGTARSDARMQIAMGTLTIGGEEITGEKFDFKRSQLVGKLIEVVGETKHFRMTYQG